MLLVKTQLFKLHYTKTKTKQSNTKPNRTNKFPNHIKNTKNHWNIKHYNNPKKSNWETGNRHK